MNCIIYAASIIIREELRMMWKEMIVCKPLDEYRKWEIIRRKFRFNGENRCKILFCSSRCLVLQISEVGAKLYNYNYTCLLISGFHVQFIDVHELGQDKWQPFKTEFA
jgi:hypothetical protein